MILYAPPPHTLKFAGGIINKMNQRAQLLPFAFSPFFARSCLYVGNLQQSTKFSIKSCVVIYYKIPLTKFLILHIVLFVKASHSIYLLINRKMTC